jgi:RNA polymerase sigma-70 factor (ECF subfamily)
MMSDAGGQALRSRFVPPQCPATPMLSTPDLPKPLVFSSHRRVAGLFDETYLGALKERNADAQNQLVSCFSRAVLNKLRARLRSPELIQDAFQETFLRVLTYFGSGKTLDRPASLAGFVNATCQNVALELLRGHTRHDQFPENFPEPIADGLDPERQLVTEERKGMVRRLLNQLSEKDRQLLKRVFLDEEDKDAVCRELNVDRGYLRVLLYRARQSLRAVISLDSKKNAAGA